METGHFYYLNDQYFIDFPDPKLMRNKEIIDGQIHDRPSFYAFKDMSTGLYWLIPFSSQVEKFSKIYEKKVKKYGSCDTIVFGKVLGYRKAFLIQNMCPATQKYIKNEYIDHSTDIPVRINKSLEDELNTKARKVLALQRKGFSLIFPDVRKIEKEILEQKND